MTEGWFITVGVVGILANLYLLSILFKLEREMTLFKKMLLFIHVTELTILVNYFFPALAAFASAPTIQPPGLPTIYLPGWDAECVVPAFVGDAVSVLEPFSVALLAHTRWKVVRNSTKMNQQGGMPHVGRYMVALVSFALLTAIVGHATSGGYYEFSAVNLCLLEPNYVFNYCFILSFLVCAPYIGYCYVKVTQALTNDKNARTNKKRREAIRLVAVLSIYYYVSHLIVFLEFTKAVLVDPENVEGFFGLEGTRAIFLVYITHAAMTPILTVLLINRYRMYTLQLLRIIPQGSMPSALGSSEQLDGRRVPSSISSGPIPRKGSQVGFVTPPPPLQKSSTAPASPFTTPASSPRSPPPINIIRSSKSLPAATLTPHEPLPGSASPSSPSVKRLSMTSTHHSYPGGDFDQLQLASQIGHGHGHARPDRRLTAARHSYPGCDYDGLAASHSPIGHVDTSSKLSPNFEV